MLTNFVFPQYLTTDVADQYFFNRLNSDDWLNATESDKNASLVQSTRAIDNLNFSGTKFDCTQLLEFPRWYGGPPVTSTPSVPQDIVVACCENAIILLGGFDFEQELANLSVIDSSYASVRETYDRKRAVDHLKAGIASAYAWTFLMPYLDDTSTIHLSRVN